MMPPDEFGGVWEHARLCNDLAAMLCQLAQPRCAICGTDSTPQWRHGWVSAGPCCNRCSLRYFKRCLRVSEGLSPSGCVVCRTWVDAAQLEGDADLVRCTGCTVRAHRSCLEQYRPGPRLARFACGNCKHSHAVRAESCVRQTRPPTTTSGDGTKGRKRPYASVSSGARFAGPQLCA